MPMLISGLGLRWSVSREVKGGGCGEREGIRGSVQSPADVRHSTPCYVGIEDFAGEGGADCAACCRSAGFVLIDKTRWQRGLWG